MKKETVYKIIDIKDESVFIKLNKKTFEYSKDKFLYKPVIDQKVILSDKGLFIPKEKYCMESSNKTKLITISIIFIIIMIIAIIVFLYYVSGCAACVENCNHCANIG